MVVLLLLLLETLQAIISVGLGTYHRAAGSPHSNYTNRLSSVPSFRVRSARDMGALPGIRAAEEESRQTSREAVQGALQVLNAQDSSVSFALG